ncbi:hypothetical protein QTP88_012248 [Uroleucon formosanum]
MVSNKCCVPGCTKSAASKFGVPQNMISVWENIIGCSLNRNSRICLRKPRLKSGVIPINNISDKVNDINQANETMTMLNEHNYFKVNLNDEFEPPLVKRACIELSDSVIESISEVLIQDDTLINDESSISLPMNWFCDVTTKNGSVIAKTYFTLSPLQVYNNRIVEKRLVMLKDSEPTFYFNEKQIKLTQVGINNYDETLNVEYMLNILVKVKVYRGVKTDKKKFNGHWRHANCLNIIDDASQLCVWCHRLKYTINKKFIILSAGKSLRVPLIPSKKSKFKKILKPKKCEVCINNLKNDGNLGFLTHPRGNLYKILKVLETCFCKHASGYLLYCVKTHNLNSKYNCLLNILSTQNDYEIDDIISYLDT